MIHHVIQKKRVIVMDCDITMGEDVWRKIMRHVLGRHFADLRGKGPGWSFSHTHLETFSNMVKEHLSALPEENKETTTTTHICPEKQSFQDSETQTTGDDGQEGTHPPAQNCCHNGPSLQNNDQKSFGNSETQTCPKVLLLGETVSDKKHVYRFDVDEQVRLFVDHWVQKANFLV
jgi:hypothetical protein